MVLFGFLGWYFKSSLKMCLYAVVFCVYLKSYIQQVRIPCHSLVLLVSLFDVVTQGSEHYHAGK